MQLAEITFWAFAIILCWTFIGYPVAVILLGYLTPRHRPKLSGEHLPPLLVIIPFRNKQAMVKSSHDAVFAADYPKELLQILLVDNGSRDDTRRRVIETTSTRFNTRAILFEKPVPRGRILKEAAQSHFQAEIFVMIEPGLSLTPSVLRKFAQAFRDSGVGAVGGRAIFHPRLHAARQWWWHSAELFIQKIEAQFETSIGCCPMLYAVRREIAEITDPREEADTLAVTFAACARGKVVRIEPEAIGFVSKSDIDTEFHRLIDSCAGVIFAVIRKPWLLVPVLNPLWWQFTSHMLLRIFSPFVFLGLLFCSIILADESRFMLTVCITQFTLHFLGLLCAAFPRLSVFPLRLLVDVYRLNVASVMGFWKALAWFLTKPGSPLVRHRLR